MPTVKNKRAKIKAIKESVEHWQKVLRLQDWTIEKIDISPTLEDFAETRYSIHLKRASIVFADPDLFPDENQSVTICHELLHLHFAPFFVYEKDNAAMHLIQEQVIETIAQAVVGV